MMSYRGNNNKVNKVRKPLNGSANKPDFVMISNIYDDLSIMVDKYGINKVIEHLGCIASEKVSREFASKLWFLTK